MGRVTIVHSYGGLLVRRTSTHSEDLDTTPPRKSKLPRQVFLILHGGTNKFFGTLISFFRSFISFFRSFISPLGGEFSFPRELWGDSSVEIVVSLDISELL